MTQKQLEKLSRKRLLELLAQQTGRADRLERENNRLKERIADRELHLLQMGTLAQTVIQNAGQMGRVQGEQYLQEIESLTAPSGDGGGEEPEPPGHIDWPTREQLLLEAQREGGKRRYLWSLKTTVYAMITVAAAAVLVAVLLLPVLQIYGTSMNPTLYEGDFVVSVKGGKMETGDLVAFYYNNKILVKRVIGQSGQWIDITEDGTVYVDNVKIDEPYLSDRGLGECDIELPYQVPDNQYFVMGDHRSTSADSRSTSVGCVSIDAIVGRLLFRIWPLNMIQAIH